MILASALTLASKHSGVVFVAGAFAWIAIAEFVGRRQIFRLIARLIISGLLILALFVALSPALWNNPPARFRDLLDVRAELIGIQIAIDPNAPTTLPQRLAALVTQPFINPLEHFELPSWGQDEAYRAEIARYMDSPLSGLQAGIILGAPLMILAGIGIIAALIRRNGGDLGLLAWLLITAASLLVNPLPWQRYYLAYIPIVIVFAGVGLDRICQRIKTLTDSTLVG